MRFRMEMGKSLVSNTKHLGENEKNNDTTNFYKEMTYKQGMYILISNPSHTNKIQKKKKQRKNLPVVMYISNRFKELKNSK